jgi:hypothetical protein
LSIKSRVSSLFMSGSLQYFSWDFISLVPLRLFVNVSEIMRDLVPLQNVYQ